MRGKLSARLPSPAMLVALGTLFVALGGTAYAAFSVPKNSVGTKQLKNGAVTAKKIAHRAVSGSKLNLSGVTVPSAANSNSLGGSPASAYRENWALVSASGTVTASSGEITVAKAGTGGYYVKFPESQLNHGISVTQEWTKPENIDFQAVICTATKQGTTCDPPAGNDSRNVFVDAAAPGKSLVDRGFYIVSTP